MAINPKFVQLLESLNRASEKGRIKWSGADGVFSLKTPRATFAIEEETTAAGLIYVLSLDSPEGINLDMEIVRHEDDCYDLASQVFERARRSGTGVDELLDELVADLERAK